MIPSTSKLPELSIHNVYQGNIESSIKTPLNERYVINNSHLKCNEGMNFRHMGMLSWFENQDIASLKERVNFINNLTFEVVKNYPFKDKPITLISLGSGGLLMESFIHKSLNDNGYMDINWRVIDIGYLNNGFELCRKEFKENTDGKVKAFTTEQTYLKKQIDGKSLAEHDKSNGFTVMLSIDPPTALSSEKKHEVDCMMVRGRPVDDIQKANAIYLLVTDKQYKDVLYEIPNALSGGDSVIATDSVLKCWININDSYEVCYSPSVSGRSINSSVCDYLKLENESAALSNKKMDLLNIDKVFERYLIDLTRNSEGKSGIRFYVSDYDTSIKRLNDYFMENNHSGSVMFSSFSENTVRFDMMSF